jgi:hypothetical protein
LDISNVIDGILDEADDSTLFDSEDEELQDNFIYVNNQTISVEDDPGSDCDEDADGFLEESVLSSEKSSSSSSRLILPGEVDPMDDHEHANGRTCTDFSY